MDSKLKTLRDHILEGGIRGKYFVGKFHNCNLFGEGIYKVVDILEVEEFVRERWDFAILARHLTGTDTLGIYSYDLREHYGDIEAGVEEVRRARLL